MQIRYLEAMQTMAKSANSKVIFLPAANQTMPGSAAFNAALATATTSGNNPFEEGGGSSGSAGRADAHDFGAHDSGFQQAMNARVIENI